MTILIRRCRRCRSVLQDDGTCLRCAFRPHFGKFQPGFRPHVPFDLSHNPADLEDDYSDEASADDVFRTRDELHYLPALRERQRVREQR